jgi:hypothetical protein
MLGDAATMYRTGEGAGVSDEMEEVEEELKEKGLMDHEQTEESDAQLVGRQ